MKTDYWTVDPFYIDLCQGITPLPNVEEKMQYVVEHSKRGWDKGQYVGVLTLLFYWLDTS